MGFSDEPGNTFFVEFSDEPGYDNQCTYAIRGLNDVKVLFSWTLLFIYSIMNSYLYVYGSITLIMYCTSLDKTWIDWNSI